MTCDTLLVETTPQQVLIIEVPGIQGPPGGSARIVFASTDITAEIGQVVIVDTSDGPVTVTLGDTSEVGQVAVVKDDSSDNSVVIPGFDSLTDPHASATFIADGIDTWRIVMSYTPGQSSLVSEVNALKDAAISARVTQAGSATPISAAFGTQYEITGSTNQTINLPASSSLPAGSTGVVIVKCGPSYTGTITVSPASGTIDNASSFQVSGPGQENIFEVGTSDADWQVG